MNRFQFPLLYAFRDVSVSILFLICPVMAVYLFRQSAEEGDIATQFNLGLIYDLGRGVPQDKVEAARWYRKAALQDDDEAQYTLGRMYYNGDGVPKDEAAAFGWFRKAANQGHGKAQYRLGCMYKRGEGVSQSYPAATRCFRNAAEQGDEYAQALLVAMQAEGKVVSKVDEPDYAPLFGLAAKLGNADAQYRYGSMYERGEGAPRSKEEAFKWYCRAAKQGHVQAQSIIAVLYEFGDGVRQDKEEAIKWLRRAAEQGDAESQYFLGAKHYHGAGGIPQDFAQAMKWFRLAAEQGDDELLSLLSCFLLYQSEDEDSEEGLRWVRIAAEQGEAWAQLSVGRIHAGTKSSRGQRKHMLTDAVQAYAWFSLAAAQGMELANNKIADLISLMAPAQIAEAQSLSHKFQEAYGSNEVRS